MGTAPATITPLKGAKNFFINVAPLNRDRIISGSFATARLPAAMHAPTGAKSRFKSILSPVHNNENDSPHWANRFVVAGTAPATITPVMGAKSFCINIFATGLLPAAVALAMGAKSFLNFMLPFLNWK